MTNDERRAQTDAAERYLQFKLRERREAELAELERLYRQHRRMELFGLVSFVVGVGAIVAIVALLLAGPASAWETDYDDDRYWKDRDRYEEESHEDAYEVNRRRRELRDEWEREDDRAQRCGQGYGQAGECRPGEERRR